MEARKNRCVTHQEFFPKEEELRYEFEFNSLEGICKRCQEQAAKLVPATITAREQEEKAARLNTPIQVNVTKEMKATLDYIANRRDTTKASIYREAFALYINYRLDYESD